jgi:hypothetical protein
VDCFLAGGCECRLELGVDGRGLKRGLTGRVAVREAWRSAAERDVGCIVGAWLGGFGDGRKVCRRIGFDGGGALA